MTFLPIVARELRVAARKRSTFWVRTLAALAVILLGTFFFLMMQREQSTPHQIAQVLFGLLTGSAVIYSLFSGVGSTADCLSEEKREGTFGLLFLTDLKGYDVVLGKLAACSLNGIYGMIAVVPMLAIPLLMGGVSPAEFGRMSLVAVNTLFFSLALGMCISAMSRSARKAMIVTLLLLLLFTAGLPALGAWLSYKGVLSGRAARDGWLLLPSAGRAYFLAWDPFYLKGWRGFWTSLGTIHGLGWIFLAMASIIAPRTWQDKPAGVQSVRWRERLRLLSLGKLAERDVFRRRLLDINPFFWLAARVRMKPAQVWAGLGLMACGWLWGWTKLRREWLEPGIFLVTGAALVFVILSWVASESGSQLAEDRKSGALELLLSTPLTIQDILRGQRLALQRQFLGPVSLTLILGLVFMLAPLNRGEIDSDRDFWVWLWLGGMTLFVAHLFALYWVGMWQALTAKHPMRAVSGNFFRILILPNITWALICMLRAVPSPLPEPSWKFFLGWWVGLGLAADLFFGLRSRFKLLTQFRHAATQRYTQRRRSPKQWASEVAAGGPLPPVIAMEK